MNKSEGSGAQQRVWVRPVCISGALLVVSVACVKIANQADGANKLKAFASVVGALASLAE